MAVNNFYYVAFLSTTVHWEQLLLPLYMPALTSFLYYIVTIVPLLMCLLSLSYNINHGVELPEKLKGFSVTDKTKCFGLSYLGNALSLISLFIFMITLPPIGIQLIQKGKITLGSLIAIPFAWYLLYITVFKPGLKLSLKLANIKRENECNEREKIESFVKQMEANQDNAAMVHMMHQKLDSISSQKIVPISKPFAIGGYFVLAPVLSVSIIVWIKKLFDAVKVVSGS